MTESCCYDFDMNKRFCKREVKLKTLKTFSWNKKKILIRGAKYSLLEIQPIQTWKIMQMENFSEIKKNDFMYEKLKSLPI